MPSPWKKAPISSGRPTAAGKGSGSILRWLLLGFLVLSVAGPFVMHHKSLLAENDHLINEAPRVVATTPATRTLGQSSSLSQTNPPERIRIPEAPILTEPPVAAAAVVSTEPPQTLTQNNSADNKDSEDSDSDDNDEDEGKKKDADDGEATEQRDAANDSEDSDSDDKDADEEQTVQQNNGDKEGEDSDEGGKNDADEKDGESKDDESGDKDEEDSNPTDGDEGSDALIASSKPGAVWQNDQYDMVHIIYSRFMQHQPNLVKLGLARLELFKTFCFPSISQQTNQQFLWIIRTDPELHPTLKDGLIDAVQGMPNVAVIGSNEVKKGSVDRGWRNGNATGDITEGSLFYGSMDLIQSYHEAVDQRTLLETNLDADDGLGLTFVERAQNLTFARFQELAASKQTNTNRAFDRKDAWINLCVGRHLEWQFYAPWDKTTTKGSLHVGSTHICVTPGLSWATQPDAHARFIKQHHLVKKHTPACDDPQQKKAPFMGCWVEIPVPGDDVMAIRARTPTSTGMNRVVMSESDWKPEEEAMDRESWPLLEPSFAIPQTLVESSHKYLSDHLQELVEENLKGQCTKDHSCSEGIKKKLKALFFQGGKWQNKHDLVHVVHTFHPFSALAVSKYFSFESMESQTTYEFLWIIYVEDASSNFVYRNQMTKRPEKSGLDILVVQADGPVSPTVDFRSPEAMSIFSNDTLIYGEMSLLESFHQAAQTRTVLETTLGANEAVSKTFMADLQNETVTRLQNNADNEKSWYYHCSPEYYEWRAFNPANLEEESETGFWNLATPPENEKCVERPGTTRIAGPQATLPSTYDVLSLEPCSLDEERTGCVVDAGKQDGARAIVPGLVKDENPLKLSPGDLSNLVSNQKDIRAEVTEAFNVYMDKPRVRAIREKLKKHETDTIPEPLESIRNLESSNAPAPRSDLSVTTALDTWQNNNDVVHILYSRFMQHQPDLLELGKARLELFKTFCLPTISHQTNQQFLWIIRTDPELHPVLRDGLLESVQGIENIVVVGSNEVRKGSVDNGFRNKKAIADITPESIFYGNRDLVLSFQEATVGRIVLETNLDADDGLGLTFMETTQSMAKTAFEKIPSKNGWFNLCVGRHLEWQYFAPWDKHTDRGSFELGSTHICVTPGLSWATQPNAVPGFTVQHHMIKQNTPSCKKSNKPFLGCWIEIPGPRPQDPMAIRARTPTSTGMNGVKTSHEGDWGPKAKALDDETWPLLEPDLAIPEALVKSSHKYLKDHLNLLVAENLKGQCTKDHSCSEGIKKKLKSLFFDKGSWINKHDLVHVLHMEVPEKLNLSKLFVGWEPVETQTVYEFLWILYVSPNIDQDSRNALMKKLKRSPLNVVAMEPNQAPTTTFRDAETLSGLSTKKLLFGDMALVQSFHEASQNRTLLETSLRANEAITKTFVGEIQNRTFDQLDQFGSSDWYYHCVSEYLEWRGPTPQAVEPAHGFVSIAKRPSEHCTHRPGTTVIMMPDAKIPDGWKKEDSKPCDKTESRNGCYTQSGERNGARALLPGIVDVAIGYEGQGAELEQLKQDQPNLREDLHENFAIERFHLRQMVKTLNGDN
ncbi:unnamed protein product [Cylindrotheca closterium]|uniref:Uncharacterized protein n=1 Tax=Cylindrotheca closterium TaxID=2856 RepID=A0AAD2CC36_9STRA|nr:unnamed protein product [Cylindrotheca closterium]